MNQNQLDNLLQNALAAHKKGQYDVARNAYESVLRSNPNELKALYFYALLEQTHGRYAQALTMMQSVAKAQPNDLDVIYNLGVIQLSLEDYDSATQAFEHVISKNPEHFLAINNTGLCQFEQANFEQALKFFQRALEIKPDYVESLVNIANVFIKLEKNERAEAYCEKAHAIAPTDFKLLITYGNVFSDSRPEKSVHWYEKALEQQPQNNMAKRNLARAFRKNAQYQKAISLYEELFDVAEYQDEATENLSILYFRECRWLEGARYYFFRNHHWHYDQKKLDVFERLFDRDFLVLGEQGLGDELFFLRFVPQLKEKSGRRIFYSGDPRINHIIEPLGIVDGIIADAKETRHFHRIYVGDLPLLLWSRFGEEIPPSIGLKSEASKVASIKQRLASYGPPPYVGLTWRAGIAEKDKLYKEFPLSELAGLISKGEATYVSLQRGLQSGELDQLQELSGKKIHDCSDINNDLSLMLALLDAIDDYYCVSNTNLHLRVALGKQIRVLVPHPAEWRWETPSKHSVWFPDVYVYRQSQSGEWTSAVRALQQDLGIE